MALKDILVHVDNSRACQARLKAAIDLAQSHGAHLTGLYVYPRLEIPTYVETEVGVDLMEVQQEAARTKAEQAEEEFKTTAEKTDLATEWRCVEGALVNNLNLHARYVDLVIAGQADSEDPESISAGVADKVVLEVGRPVLVIPYIGVSKPIGKRVMVAWNASREAVRAINDALPLLQRAQKVDVVAVNPSSGPAGNGDIPSADICLHLARHGVAAEAHHIRASDMEVGDILLGRAADEGIDLIVTGAYGHSRFREWVLGGTTRHLLAHMTAPVLMSH